MIKLDREPKRDGPKPILAVLNRSNHDRELNALVAANNRTRFKRDIVVASTVLDDRHPWDEKTSDLSQYACIWAGGSSDIDMTHSTPLLTQFFFRMEPVVEQADNQGIPIFAECFSHQGITVMRGGKVVRDETRWEGGTVLLHLTEEGRRHPLFEGLPDKVRILSLHKDSISQAPPDQRTTVLAWSEGNPAYPGSEGNPYAVITTDTYTGIQQHTLYTPETIAPVFAETNKRIIQGAQLEPFPQTHPFGPIDDCESITVNFFNALPVEKNIFVPTLV